MDQIITFADKSLYNRREEYKSVFEDGYVDTDIRKLWSEFLETYVEPIGWQGIWKIKRKTCESLKLIHPTTLFILIKYINFEELSAQVKVLEIEDAIEHDHVELNKIEVGKEYHAPLIEIYPTNTQEPSVILNLSKTAECLDAFRYFYNKLWFPTDIDLYNNADSWFHKNLESRLQLSYDLNNGTVPSKITKDILSVTSTAKHLDTQKLCIENLLDDDFDFDNSPLAKTLAKIDMKLNHLQTKFHILEQPNLRTVYYEHQNVSKPVKENDDKSAHQTCIVFDRQLPLDEQLTFLKTLDDCAQNECEMKYVLQNSLDCATAANLLILNGAQHEIDETVSVNASNWRVKGVVVAQQIPTIVMNLNLVMLDLSGENVTLENVALNLCCAPIGLIVRKGRVTLNGCVIRGDRKSSTTQRAIVVFPEAQLVMNDCQITETSIAVVGKTCADMSFNNCRIENNNIGLKISDECVVNVADTSISRCALFAVYLETLEAYQRLEELPYANVVGLKMENNYKNCALKRKHQITPHAADIFSETFFVPNFNDNDVGNESDMELLENDTERMETTL